MRAAHAFSPGLVAVPRGIGVARQGGGFGAVVGVEGNAHARGYIERVAVELERVVDCCTDLVCDPFGVLRRRDSRQQHHELVATDACGGVRFADALADARGHATQHMVSDGMAEAVVDRLDAVEVD